MSKDRGLQQPFHFLVDTAQGHLRKANFSRKARMKAQELRHLRRFEEVAGASVPSHPLYREKKARDRSVMEIETQLEEVRKRIKNLESCLEHESSLTDEEWLDSKLDGKSSSRNSGRSINFASDESLDGGSTEDYLVGTRAIPVSTRDSALPVVGKPRQVRIQESTDGSVSAGHCNDSSVGPAMKSLYKQFLEGGSPEKSIEEFRQTLKTLENLGIERKESLVEEYTRQKIESYQQDDARSSSDPKATKTEDLDLLKSFIASGWNLLSAENEKDGAASSRNNAESRRKTGAGKERFEERRKPPTKSSGHSQSQSQSGRSGTDDEAQQIKVFREKWEASRKKEAEQIVLKDRLKEDADLRCDWPAARDVQHSQHAKPSPVLAKMVEMTDMDRLRNDMEARFATMTADAERWRKQHSQQMQSLLEERAGVFASQQFNALVAGTLSEMKGELSVVREELRSVEKARGGLQKEQECLRYETGRVRMELQSARDAAHQSRIGIESLKKENDHRISKLSQDVADLKTMEEPLVVQREVLKKIAEMLQTDGIATKSEFQAFKSEHEAICGRILIEGEKEKAVIMDRVEHLSQLYLGGLEDVKTEVSNLKVSLDSSSSARSESLLAEMRRRNKKCVQLEGLMKERFEAAAKLQEKYNAELEKAKEHWNWTLNVQVGEAKTMLGNVAEERRAQIGSRFEATRLEQTAILNRIQSVEDRVMQLTGTVQSATSDPLMFANMEKHQEVIQNELHRLDEQMRDALRRIEHLDANGDDQRIVGLRSELDTLGQKVRDATKSRTVILDKMGEMGKKVRKLEAAQVEFIRSLEEVRASTSDLERSASTWLPKYETAADHLKDMDSRLSCAENLIREYAVQGDKKEDDVAESSSSACVELLHTRVETLEGRVEHVASATITNLRILDSKVEHYRVGVQSAIEGAAMAESKCGVLGAELVKVFRMLAARNGKLSDSGKRSSPMMKTECPKGKVQRANCRFCKKPEEIPDAAEGSEHGFAHDDCYDPTNGHGQQAGPMINGKAAGRSNCQGESLSFIESYAESFYESGQNFKKNLTSSKGLSMPAADKFGKKKDHNHKAGCKSCQRTNIRLEAGRIHVNVCHRVAGANRNNRPENVLVQPQKPMY